jgi:hypothetical protein
MLENFNTKKELQYQKLTLEEQKQRGILGRLVGIMADFKQPTRNGRLYTEELWDKTFEDPIMKEKIDNRCLFGELGHPAERQEIDMEKICICLAETPKKGDNGKIYGVFDILDTPNGRILKTLCDYGCNIGVSSRGSGDVTEDYDGTEKVEPDSYECECWDAVLLPAVKSARPKYVTESLKTQKSLRLALNEEVEKSSEEDKKVMKQTLNELAIDYSTEQVDENNPEKVEDIDVVQEETQMAAEDNGAETIRELQESLAREVELEKQIKTLQEKLSVCYTKESRYSNTLSRTMRELAQTQADNATLSEQLKEKENQLTAVNEQLISANAEVKEQQVVIAGHQKRIKALTEHVDQGKGKTTSLTESLAKKDQTIKTLQEQVSTLTESHKKNCDKLEAEKKQLIESLADSKKDNQILKSQSTAKLTQAQQLVEKYQSIAKTAVDKYISSQARRLGVKPEDIKGKLKENYSFNDIDHVCEELQRYKLNVNSLPFNMTAEKKPVRMTIKESKEVISTDNGYNADDEIDSTLRGFI